MPNTPPPQEWFQEEPSRPARLIPDRDAAANMTIVRRIEEGVARRRATTETSPTPSPRRHRRPNEDTISPIPLRLTSGPTTLQSSIRPRHTRGQPPSEVAADPAPAPAARHLSEEAIIRRHLLSEHVAGPIPIPIPRVLTPARRQSASEATRLTSPVQPIPTPFPHRPIGHPYTSLDETPNWLPNDNTTGPTPTTRRPSPNESTPQALPIRTRRQPPKDDSLSPTTRRLSQLRLDIPTPSGEKRREPAANPTQADDTTRPPPTYPHRLPTGSFPMPSGERLHYWQREPLRVEDFEQDPRLPAWLKEASDRLENDPVMKEYMKEWGGRKKEGGKDEDKRGDNGKKE